MRCATKNGGQNGERMVNAGFWPGYERLKERRTEAPRSAGEVGEVKLTDLGEDEVGADEVGEGGKPLLVAASEAYAAGGGGECGGEAKGIDAGSSNACSTCGAATCLPSKWLAASKMASA